MNYNSILQNPRITEKATMVSEYHVYTFDVSPSANKIDIAKAVKAIYKVTPVKVNIVVSKPRKVVSRGRIGQKKGGKKAMVYLKKGDKIEFI
jgi:large subunit ribosomal protein L23